MSKGHHRESEGSMYLCPHPVLSRHCGRLRGEDIGQCLLRYSETGGLKAWVERICCYGGVKMHLDSLTTDILSTLDWVSRYQGEAMLL
jgi:hypothetical protein